MRPSRRALDVADVIAYLKQFDADGNNVAAAAQ
jgi:hypothetical protein